MKRRGFFSSLIGAAAATTVGIQVAPEVVEAVKVGATRICVNPAYLTAPFGEFVIWHPKALDQLTEMASDQPLITSGERFSFVNGKQVEVPKYIYV